MQKPAYCGRYFHPGYGNLEIVEKDGSLSIIFPQYTFRLAHSVHRTYKIRLNEEIPQILDPDFFTFTFREDAAGKIHALETNLAVDPVVFSSVRLGYDFFRYSSHQKFFDSQYFIS